MPEVREIARALPEPLLAAAGEFLAARVGMRFPRERWSDLARGLRSAAHELGHPDADSCARWLLAAHLTRREIEILASHLTVGETYFFRERKSFECLEQHLLPELLRSRRAGDRRFRIWSAGCSTGEEPYSIAMVLSGAIPDLAGWNVSILATDINPRALRKAALGVYGEWSFRDTPAGTRERFFTRTKDGRFAIDERIRSMVTFAYLNLAEDNYPAVENGTNAMDIVFCRNVLMYFDPAHGRRVLERLARSLVNEGWLFVNPVEISQIAVPQLTTVNLPGAIVYRKGVAPVAGAQQIAAIPAASRDVAAARLERATVAEPPAPPRETSPEIPLAEETWPARAETPARSAYEKATGLYALGNYSEAAEALREPLSRDPGDPKAMALLARCCANQGDLAAAARWCSQTVSVDKLNPAWNYLLATILQEQGAAKEAALALRRALYLDPDHVLAHFALGNLARREGKQIDAERHFRNALAVLSARREDEILAESEGITAGRLAEIIQSSMSGEAAE